MTDKPEKPVPRLHMPERKGPLIQLPHGQTLVIRNALAGSLYSAVVLNPDAPTRTDLHTPRFFEIGPWMDLPAYSGGGHASNAHTNLPRSGNVGLPYDWTFVTVGWRARVSTGFKHPALHRFAADTALRFYYNGKPYYSAPLSELLQNEPAPLTLEAVSKLVFDPSPEAVREMEEKLSLRTVLLTANLSFNVELQLTVRGRLALRDFFHDQPEYPLTLWCFLDGILTKPI